MRPRSVGHRHSEQLEPSGDDGVYAAEYNDTDLPDGICDSTVTRSASDPGATHNFETREFIGAAMGEGYAHFLASAILNNRTATNPEFAYYANVMKSSSNPNSPVTCGGSALYCNAPHIPLTSNPDTDSDPVVTWMRYECDAPTNEGFQHFGTEWDWLNFFWSLWAGGTSTTRYTLAQIANVWSQVPLENAARLCCLPAALGQPNPPTNCIKALWHNDNNCSSCPTGSVNCFNVGNLWTEDLDYGNDADNTQVLETVYSLYGSTPSKYLRFYDLGGVTGVNY